MKHLKHFETYICNILVSSTNQGQPPLRKAQFWGVLELKTCKNGGEAVGKKGGGG
jgi:hypothetical protein